MCSEGLILGVSMCSKRSFFKTVKIMGKCLYIVGLLNLLGALLGGLLGCALLLPQQEQGKVLELKSSVSLILKGEKLPTVFFDNYEFNLAQCL